MDIYINGEFSPLENSQDLFEPGFLFGWGAFESMRIYGGRPGFFSMHIERLKNGCGLLGLEEPEENWQEIANRLISDNATDGGYLRITAYRKRKGTGVAAYTNKFSYYTDADYQKGFVAVSSPYRRPSGAISSKVKSISYLDNRLAWFGAQKQGKQEAIIFNEKGILCGGSRSNIFLLIDSSIFTPALGEGAFRGITRQVIIDIAARLEIPVFEKDLYEKDILNCSQAFITSSLMEVMPLVEYNNKVIGGRKPGELTLSLLKEYRNRIYEKA